VAAATKYGKYILRPAQKVIKPAKGKSASTPVVLEELENWGGIKHRMKWLFITKPVLMLDQPHFHNFDEILGFYSCDPANALDFGAEIELSLGREGEKQIIKAPTVICLPKGLIHCPLNFKTITKPILFYRIYLSPKYVRKAVT
jgi:hypothetical protein